MEILLRWCNGVCATLCLDAVCKTVRLGAAWIEVGVGLLAAAVNAVLGAGLVSEVSIFFWIASSRMT